jgi:outer membrane lipoprotein-sorting protein
MIPTTLTCLALLSAPAPQLRGTDMLKDIVSTLQDARTLKAEYLYGDVDGVPLKYTLIASKPNRLRVENDSYLVIADGSFIWTIHKWNNTFSREPQDEESLRALVTLPALTMWGSFFYTDLFQSVQDPIYAGSFQRGANEYKGVKFNFLEDYSATLYMDMRDKLPKQAEFSTTFGGHHQAYVFNTDVVELDKPLQPRAFAWDRPASAKEVPPATEVWFDDIKQAQGSAWSTRRLVMMVFYAGWSSYSGLLEVELFPLSSFKRTGRDFVFMKVDVDKQPELAEKYGVKTVPTMIFTRPNGQVLASKTGRVKIRDYQALVTQAKHNAGRK